MKTNLINYKLLGSIVLLLTILLMGFSLEGTFAANATIDENSTGGIIAAVNNPSLNSGDTLFLTPGTYNKTNQDTNITINKSVTIQGNGSRDSVKIDGIGQNRIMEFRNIGLTVTFINVSFINAYSDSTLDGAAIYITYARLSFINCSFYNNFQNNTGAGSGGAAIFNWADNFYVDNCIFINNSAQKGGGAIFNHDCINTTITGSTFINNTAGISGGAIYNAGNFSNVINCSFSFNTANDTGGAICNMRQNFTITDSNFTNNTARFGGAIYYTASDSNYNNVNSTIRGSNFINNTANSTGGAIHRAFSDNFTIIGSTFINNSAYSTGGATYVSPVNNFNVINSSFINNSIVAGHGGAIYYSGINFTVNGSNFTNNSAGSGGAIASNSASSVNNDSSSQSNVIIIDSNFINNIATSGGGAIYNGANAYYPSVPTIIGRYGSNFFISGCNFTDNAAGNNTTSVRGGAIYNYAFNFTVIDSNFTNNFANYGGGIFNDGTIIVNRSIFDNNSQAIGLGNTNYVFDNNTIINNIIAVQFVLINQTYIIPDLIGLTTPSINVNIPNIIANNTYGIGISGSGSNYTLADSSYNNSNNKNGIIFTGMGAGSTVSGMSYNNKLVNSVLRGFSGVGLTFDIGSFNNTVSNCNISNNNIGVLMSGTNNSLSSSNIIDNSGLGINVTNYGNNSLINYNRISNNFNYGLANYGISTNANYNWWGENYIVDQYYNNPGSNLALDFYYVLQLSLNYTLNNTINRNRTYSKDVFATLSYELTLNDASVSHNKTLLPYFMVNILLNNSTSVILNFSQDARDDYNWTNVIITSSDPSAQIRVLADNEDLYLRIDNITRFVNLTITKVANVTEVVINETVQYMITVINQGSDVASGVEVYEILPSGLVYLNSSTTIGTYNPTTGLWLIGNLAVGQTATFVIDTRVVANGTIINIVTLTTTDRAGDIENANATITVVSEPDPVLDSDEPVYETNDTQTNTPRASMKHTGMPLIATLLVLISLIAIGISKKQK